MNATPASTTGWATHVFGATLTPAFVMPWFYAPRAKRLAEGGEIHYHAMANGGLGRTDRIVESYLPLLDEARSNGEKLRLMGHSLGGVVAWALAHECGDVVDTVEVWGAPLRGTGVAGFFRHVVAEARFLSPMSRWLESYDRPLNGPRARSMYTAIDLLVQPPRQSCYVEGDGAENHYVTPLGLRRRDRRPGEQVHVGLADHVLLPRYARLVAAAA
jgi:pimeloyl-ACP methyl ester carboxylesterase